MPAGGDRRGVQETGWSDELEQDRDIKDDVRAVVEDDRVAVHYSPAVASWQRHQLALERHRKRFKPFLPSRRKLPGPLELFLEAGRQVPIPGRVVLPDDLRILPAEDDLNRAGYVLQRGDAVTARFGALPPSL